MIPRVAPLATFCRAPDLIGANPQESLDHPLFWNVADLERKLELFKDYYNHSPTDVSLAGIRLLKSAVAGSPNLFPCTITTAKSIVVVFSYFRLQLEYHFATDKIVANSFSVS